MLTAVDAVVTGVTTINAIGASFQTMLHTRRQVPAFFGADGLGRAGGHTRTLNAA